MHTTGGPIRVEYRCPDCEHTGALTIRETDFDRNGHYEFHCDRCRRAGKVIQMDGIQLAGFERCNRP